jgi:hypothetical protein
VKVKLDYTFLRENRALNNPAEPQGREMPVQPDRMRYGANNQKRTQQ